MATDGSAGSCRCEFLFVGPKEAACTELLSRIQTTIGGEGRVLCLPSFLQNLDDCICDFVVFTLSPEQVISALPAVTLTRERHPFLHLVVALERYDDRIACQVFRAGASDVVADADVKSELQRWIRANNIRSRQQQPDAEQIDRWIGSSPSARHLRSWALHLAFGLEAEESESRSDC